MKRKNILNTLLAFGSALFLTGALQSCDDYLTIYPTDQITEEEFWQDKNDVENVRAAAYQQLTKAGQTAKILQWGEFRSDNLTLYTMSNTSIMHMQNAVLMPTESMFDWSGFYTGINYCNLILEKGQKMVDTSVDPSFGESDWRPIKAEITALRALYYFYLVRAFRDVPYVSQAVTTDEQAMRAATPATPGVAVLGDLIDSLEVVKNYAATNFGSNSDNKGRFTKRGVRTLLADIYLWRGCLLKNFQNKTDNYSQIVNLDDVVTDSTSTDSTVAGSVYTADGTLVDQTYTDALAKECFLQAKENASWVLDDMMEEYKEDLEENATATSEQKLQKYPLILITTSNNSTRDNVYNQIFGTKNSTESIFELQYDGTNNSNSTIGSYFSSMSSGSLSTGTMVANSTFANVGSVESTKGFGKTDVRMLETMQYQTNGTSSSYPIIKGVATNITITSQNAEDMSEGATYDFRSNANANWPVYRLSDLMLIKAEAIARYYSSTTTNNEDLYEAFDMVNSIFMRCNPALRPSNDGTGELITTRLNGIYGANYDHDATGYYGKGKTAESLLTLVYQERQREFVGEGKFWFDLVREAEATNDPTTALTSYMSLTSSVKNRLKQLYSLYNPVYNEEMKVNTQLIQNPIWERYSN